MLKENTSTLTGKERCLYDMMQLYEDNYRYLLRVLPDIRAIQGTIVSEYDGRPVMFVDMLEQCPYTSIMAVTHYLSKGSHFVPDMELRLRVCHDARVAEVTSYQQHARLLPVYHVPNRSMYQRHEKKQVNLFLREWLLFCLRYGFQFERAPSSI
ncbi:MAG TPA: DUF1249 domain-containing protein [Chromatiales bacterium]|nr:DUF1249 domain-containing protein [Chromatiales bacterium]